MSTDPFGIGTACTLSSRNQISTDSSYWDDITNSTGWIALENVSRGRTESRNTRNHACSKRASNLPLFRWSRETQTQTSLATPLFLPSFLPSFLPYFLSSFLPSSGYVNPDFLALDTLCLLIIRLHTRTRCTILFLFLFLFLFLSFFFFFFFP